MKSTKLSSQQWFLVLKRGESLVEEILKFCSQEEINAGYLSMIGAVSEVELGFYSLPHKKYDLNHISEDLEITNATGNIALVEGSPFLHLHGTFSNIDMKTYGGHVNSATVAGTCEVYLTTFSQEFQRLSDDDTGLKLLDIV